MAKLRFFASGARRSGDFRKDQNGFHVLLRLEKGYISLIACFISYRRRLVTVYYLATFWDAAGRAVAGPCLQRVLAAVGLSRTFLLLAGVLSLNSLVAVLYKTTAYGQEKQELVVTIKNKKTLWFDFSVLKHKRYMTFVVATSIFAVAFSVTYTHVVSQIISPPYPSQGWIQDFS